MRPKFSAQGDSFCIENYNLALPFSSFFPALAGETGKPMWVFFTNRGQAISSFGINNKDGSMLEFLPANKAYQATPSLGFRTFIKQDKKKGPWIEPFRHHTDESQQTMFVRPYELEIREVNKNLGLEINVVYFGVPQENSPVILRSLTIKNITNRPLSFKVLDGLPRIVPWGMGDFLVKNMSRTIEAFAEVVNDKDTIPVFRLKVEPDDRPDVKELEAGFFSFSIKENTFQPIIVDPHAVFGPDSSFHVPSAHFGTNGFSFNKQLTTNIMPSSFSYSTVNIPAKKEKTITSYYGHVGKPEEANALAKRIQQAPDYFETKRQEIKTLYEDLVQNFGLKTSSDVFDAYAKNTFMDNVLRGGYPISLSPKGPIVHLYSRKHGDMERDYNSFQVAATYFSQGNGNFRDVNQNRRHDVYLNPKSETTNVDFFFNLIQLDGYNPLVINPIKLIIPRDLGHHADFKMDDEFKARLHHLRKEPVMPGQLYEFVKHFCKDPLVVNNIFRDVIQKCIPQQGVQHGEGFWIDHWTYNLDQLEQYLAIYPDKTKWLLFERKDTTYYDSDHFVKPRKEKYVVTKDGRFRQLRAVEKNKEKSELIGSRKVDANLVRTKLGKGEILKTTLFVKLIHLVAIKASTLDPFGVGIEMEADKPGWCDALNGCPGLFGSSSHVMFELKRLVQFVKNEALTLSPTKGIDFPQEMAALVRDVSHALSIKSANDFRPIWDKLCTAREHFRDKTFMGVSGKTRPIKTTDLFDFLSRVSSALENATKKVDDPKTHLPTSYFTYLPNISKLSGDWKTHLIKIPWVQHRVAPFLEGAVHAMKLASPTKAKKIYTAVKKSDLRDKKLGMYKLNVSLKNESTEIGRIRVFSSGWLENESIFLHMHYKYLLEILRAGMSKEFFDEAKTGLIPFRNMEIYGRPIFENSSFLASSTFPKKELHGKGFVARLSGATSEFLTMIYTCVLGQKPFQFNNEELHFIPQPTLPGSWFDKGGKESLVKNTLSIKYMGVPITLVNPSRKDTFGPRGAKTVGFEWILGGRFYTHEGPVLTSEASLALREGRLESLTIFLK